MGLEAPPLLLTGHLQVETVDTPLSHPPPTVHRTEMLPRVSHLLHTVLHQAAVAHHLPLMVLLQLEVETVVDSVAVPLPVATVLRLSLLRHLMELLLQEMVVMEDTRKEEQPLLRHMVLHRQEVQD